jgi:hypothetical protein
MTNEFEVFEGGQLPESEDVASLARVSGEARIENEKARRAKMTDPGSSEGHRVDPGRAVAEALEESDILLAYAARSGLGPTLQIAEPLTVAKSAYSSRVWNARIEANFWAAYSSLAAALKPVTAESLLPRIAEVAERYADAYTRATSWLVGLIVPLSIVMFVNASISNDITDLIKENDVTSLSLRDGLLAISQQLGQSTTSTGAEALHMVPVNTRQLEAELAQFARVNRLLYARSQLFNVFVMRSAADPHLDRQALELPPDQVLTPQIGFAKISTYQDIRAFAKDAQQRNLMAYGAVTAYLLPVLYSLLGACAYALRSLADATVRRSYLPSVANFARIIVALIAGVVVGLFTNFTKDVSLSPLAVAFLVGYGVEIFFSFLDAFMQAFKK